MHEALGVEVERAIADAGLCEGDVARVGSEGIAHGILLRIAAATAFAEARTWRTREAVEIEPEALGGVTTGLFDQGQPASQAIEHGALACGAAATTEPRLGDAAQGVQATVLRRAMGSGRGVVELLEQLEGTLVGATREVIDLDHHAAQHHLAQQGLSERREPGLLAVIAPELTPGQTTEVRRQGADGPLPKAGHVVRGWRIVLVTWLVEPPKRHIALVEHGCDVRGTVLDEVGPVPAVDEVAELDEVSMSVARREGVVVLVHGKQHPHAARVIGIELLTHVLLVAGGHACARHREAVEQVRGLDAEDHGHLAPRDDLARLCWRVDDAKEALAWPTRLGVDVTLHVAGLLDDAIDGDHVVARVAHVLIALAHHEVADDLVGGGVLDHEA